ncbi:MAG: hypothetical protein OXE85_09765 [Roseovarius sp.]|nr:hypothetical protein [Roseovarius sp.]
MGNMLKMGRHELAARARRPERALEVGFWSAGKRDLNWRFKGLRVERGAGECCWRMRVALVIAV